MSGRERSRNRTRSLDSDLESRASQTEGSSAGGLEEDKEVASQAVLFFINGSRRGAVHLCSRIAEILRENQRLHRTVEVQRVRIEELMCSLSTAPAAPVGPSDSNRSQTSSTSLPDTSPSSPSPAFPPSLSPPPPPTSPLPQPVSPPVCPPSTALGGAACALVSHPRASPSGPPSHPHPSEETVRRREKGNLPSEQCGQTSDRKHTLKKREKVLRRSASCGPLRGEMGETKEEEEEERCLASNCPDSSSTVPSAGGGLDPRALTTRKKHRLCVNDRVVLERRRRGEERRRGAVRFIGPLDNTDATDIYIGVELDTASGENEGSLHGNRYFRCEPNHGTFTTITGIRKLSRSSHSSKPPEEDDSSDSGPGSSAVAVGRSSRGIGIRSGKGLRRTRNQMDIRAQVHSEPGGPRDKTTVENPGPD